MSQRPRFLDRLNSLYGDGPLQNQLKVVFGDDTALKPGTTPHSLKTLLLVVTRNATTDSPWPISSNPDARYNAPHLGHCNLQIPLWQLVRASTAAPVFFPPAVLQWDPKDASRTFLFEDGSHTPYKNT